MWETARQTTMYLSLTVLSLVITVGVGAAGAAPVLRRLPRTHRVTVSIALGFGALVLAPTWWAYTETRLAPLAFAVVVIAAAGLGHWAWIVRSERSSIGDRAIAGGRGGLVVAAAGSVSIMQYRRVFTSGYLPSSPTAFTNLNNDLAIYVLQADNIRAVGFGELGRAADRMIGAWAKGDHTGAAAFSALMSADLRVPSWQAAMPVIAVCTAATVLMLVHLAQLVGVRRRLAMWVAAIWAICAPFPSSIQTNYFLGQMVSRALFVALVLTIAILLLERHEPRVRAALLVLVALLVAAGLVAYPAGHIAVMAVAGGLAVCFGAFAPGLRTLVQRLGDLGLIAIAAAFGGIAVYPRWQIISDAIALYSKDNVSGFRNETRDIRVLLGVPGNGRAISVWAIAAIILILGTVCAGGLVAVRRRDWRGLGVSAAMILVPAVLYLIVVARGSTSSYQTWKTVGSVQPLAILGFVAVASNALSAFDARLQRRREPVARPGPQRWVLAVPCAALLIWVVGGAQDQWKDPTRSRALFATRYIRPEVAGLGGSALVRAQRELRINLSPYFETMVAAVAANLYDVHWAADTYLGPPSPKGTCELTTTEGAEQVRGSGPPIPVGTDLVLVPVPFCAPLPAG